MFTLKVLDPEGNTFLEEVIDKELWPGYGNAQILAFDYTAQIKNREAGLDEAEKKWRFEKIDPEVETEK